MNINFHAYREILHLAAPITAIQLCQVALTSTDLLMMGVIGLKAVAAGGLALLLYNQLRTMCVGMVTGLGNLIALSNGRGEKRTGSHAIDNQAKEEIRDLIRASMFVATSTAALASLLLILLSFSLNRLGQKSDIAALSQPVMLALAPGLFPMLWLNVMRQFAVGMRRAGSLMKVTLISIIINASLNMVFIIIWSDNPKLATAGIGFSTTMVQFFSFLSYLRTVLHDEQLRPLLALDLLKSRIKYVKKITVMGFPISMTYGSEAAITSIATILIGTFGPIALATSNIVNQLAYIVYQLNIGLSQGSSILVSRHLGKGHIGEIRMVAKRSFTISFSIMAVIALIYILTPALVLSPFTNIHRDPAFMLIAATLLWFAIAHQFLKGSQNICIGLLRGLGNTNAGLTGTIIGYWLIGIPSMFICTYQTEWGVAGIWLSLCLGFAVTSILLWRRFLAQLHALENNALSL